MIRCNQFAQHLAWRTSSVQCISNSRLVRSFSSSVPRHTFEYFDVVCIGGGPAGLSLVNGLRSSQATSGLKIALIEAQDLSKTIKHQEDLPATKYSNRCSSLTPASVKYFEQIGAWPYIQHDRVQPYEKMYVWDGVSGSQIQFDWDSTGGVAPADDQRTIAYMTENGNITSALLQRAQALGQVTFHDNTTVQNIELGTDDGELDLTGWPILTLSSGDRLAARLLVGADGANSPVRTFADIKSRGWNYERHGVVATVQLEDSLTHQEQAATAYQRFLPTGPVALLPLPDGFASLVWSTLPSHASTLKKLSSEDMAAMVNAAFRLSTVDLEYMHTIESGQADELSWRIQHTPFDRSLVPAMASSVQAGSVASFPLRMRHADTYIGERIALLGDAAHIIHPLAGQGLNLGVADATSLVQTLETAVACGADIGSSISLESYNADRYAKNHVMLGVCDKLHKLYSVGSGPLVGLRSLGLSAVNSLGVLKGSLMRVAAGA